MRRVVIHRPGSYEQLQIEELPEPSPGPGEVRLQVHFAGVNYADCIVRMGLYESAKKYVGWPITPGFEVSGVVAAVGSGVTDLVVGAPVFAVTRFFGYASAVVVPRHQVFALPSGFSAAQAAAFFVKADGQQGADHKKCRQCRKDQPGHARIDQPDDDQT